MKLPQDLSLLLAPPVVTSADFHLIRRRSSRRRASQTGPGLSKSPSSASSSSSSAGQLFRRALASVEEVGPARRVAEWRKGEVREGAVASWREEVADEREEMGDRVAGAEGERVEEALEELRRLMESSEVFSTAFALGSLALPETPIGTPDPSEAAASTSEDHTLSPPRQARSSSLCPDRPARAIRLSQQRFNPTTPPVPAVPSLYYAFPPHDPSGVLAGSALPSQPPRPRGGRAHNLPPVSSLRPKAVALLGLLPPLELPLPPTPSTFAPSFPSPSFSPRPTLHRNHSAFTEHLPPRPSVHFGGGERRSPSYDSFHAAAPSTRSGSASFWSSCLPSSSSSPSSAVAQLDRSSSPILDSKVSFSRKGSAPDLDLTSPAAKTFGARRRHALEQRHDLASTSLPELSLEALGVCTSRSSPLETSFQHPAFGAPGSPVSTLSGRSFGWTPVVGSADALGRKMSGRSGKVKKVVGWGKARGRGRAHTADVPPTLPTAARGASVDEQRKTRTLVETTEKEVLWRLKNRRSASDGEEEVVEGEDGRMRVGVRSTKRKTRDAWELESEQLRMRLRESLGY